MRYQCPLLVVADMERSRRFYENLCGLRVVMDFGANITFDAGFSLQTLESWAQFIGKPLGEVTLGANNFELYFEEDALDAFIDTLRAFDAELVHPLTEYPWGQRVVRFYDPDRHIVEVGESMATVVRRFLAQGMSVEQTAEITQHPVEFVRGCVPHDKEEDT